MIALDGLVAVVYVAILLLLSALVVFLAVGVVVVLRRPNRIVAVYFTATPVLFLVGYLLTHAFNNPDFILITAAVMLLFNSAFLPYTKKHLKRA
ncbi:hypothetical protein [Pontibacter ramchanderi]|uniref:Uncharacterized protein n=1 Tax=Pontibacter ramchanderi TaxID=1179743 RepID=A0A2N3UAI8_9BACT|nr:hypothetical protein [Pontibacter ramchanderi]PKV66371.1 hypothetical protein BD749_1497 [Pontibacter ramchanderi]